MFNSISVGLDATNAHCNKSHQTKVVEPVESKQTSSDAVTNVASLES